MSSRALRTLVLLDAFYMAVGHAPLIRVIFFSFQIGAFFLFSTLIYVVGGILVMCGKLFRLANVDLILMAIIDNILLVYTRTMPNIFFSRTIPWSSHWFLVPGTVQIFFGQAIIVVLCCVLLLSTKDAIN
ncbi:MAG: hypothetical protein ACHQ03_06325 [Candidatus Bathyarchaeia archaeon]